MNLSDPHDTTKPNPWSLDPSFDIKYGLGGQGEITLDQTTSGSDGNEKSGSWFTTDQVYDSSSGEDTSSSPVQKRKWEAKARDEEDGFDPDMMMEMGLGKRATSVLSVFPYVSNSESPTAIRTGTISGTGTRAGPEPHEGTYASFTGSGLYLASLIDTTSHSDPHLSPGGTLECPSSASSQNRKRRAMSSSPSAAAERWDPSSLTSTGG